MKIRNTFIGTLVAAAASLLVTASAANDKVHAGRANVYQNLDSNSLEHTSSPERIKQVTAGNTGPTEIWRVLEHGERVECLDCIPHVSKLVYDAHPKNREISVWWLRRRVFGVFTPGPDGEASVYKSVVDTLNDASQPEARRAFAAEAVGEFLVGAGVPHVARAAIQDTSPMVRVSAVSALKRLNSEGPNGELGTAMTDGVVDVRMTALDAATNINVFSGAAEVVRLIDDESPRVRTRAAQVLGMMRLQDSVVGLVSLARNDSDARVRAAAVAALGQIGDSGARDAVREAENDSDHFVRDAARIALRRL